jgi:uncharacterized membrane protein
MITLADAGSTLEGVGWAFIFWAGVAALIGFVVAGIVHDIREAKAERRERKW